MTSLTTFCYSQLSSAMAAMLLGIQLEQDVATNKSAGGSCILFDKFGFAFEKFGEGREERSP